MYCAAVFLSGLHRPYSGVSEHSQVFQRLPAYLAHGLRQLGIHDARPAAHHGVSRGDQLNLFVPGECLVFTCHFCCLLFLSFFFFFFFLLLKSSRRGEAAALNTIFEYSIHFNSFLHIFVFFLTVGCNYGLGFIAIYP